MSPFLFYRIFIGMKLLELIKNVILENGKPRILRFITKVGDSDIRLFSSYHQWFERHGDENYETIKDIFFDKFASNVKYRVGVPDKTIVEIFKRNMEKIINSVKDEQSKRVIFVKKRNDNEDEVEFDFIEFIIQDKGNSYEIITSAFSKDGNYLVLGFPIKTRMVMVEKEIKPKYKIVYLD